MCASSMVQSFKSPGRRLPTVCVLAYRNTSLVSAIGVMELTMTGKMAIERSAVSAEIFVAIALFYLVLTTMVGGTMRVLEHRAAGRT